MWLLIDIVNNPPAWRFDIINEIMNFEFEHQNVETIILNDEILFNPYDIGKGLFISVDGVKSQLREMDEDEKILLKNSDGVLNNIRKFNNAGEYFLKEPGLYAMLFASRKKEAKQFKKWVGKEVLPTIRKTGQYQLQQVQMLDTVELESLINKCEELKIAKAPELANIGKQSARAKLAYMIQTLSQERQIGTKALYEQLYYRYAERTGTFIPVEAMNSKKTPKEYMRTHAILAERLYELLNLFLSR